MSAKVDFASLFFGLTLDLLRACELRIEALNLEEADRKAEVAAAYNAHIEVYRELEEVWAREIAAKAEYHQAWYAEGDVRRERNRLKDKELAALRKQQATEAERGPIVRSTWQSRYADSDGP